MELGRHLAKNKTKLRPGSQERPTEPLFQVPRRSVDKRAILLGERHTSPSPLALQLGEEGRDLLALLEAILHATPERDAACEVAGEKYAVDADGLQANPRGVSGPRAARPSPVKL